MLISCSVDFKIIILLTQYYYSSLCSHVLPVTVVESGAVYEQLLATHKVAMINKVVAMPPSSCETQISFFSSANLDGPLLLPFMGSLRGLKVLWV